MTRPIDRAELERRLREGARAASVASGRTLRERVLARLDERGSDLHDDLGAAPTLARRRSARAWLAAACVVLAATIAWVLVARSSDDAERAPAPIVHEDAPGEPSREADDARGADDESRSARRAPRWDAVAGALGRTSQRALVLSSEVSELESDSRAAVRYLLGRVRLGPPDS